LNQAPLFVLKKSLTPPELPHVKQKYLFFLRHYIAYYVILVINAQNLLKFIAILNNIVNGIFSLDASYISV